jgi:hypothetical protein
MLLPILRTPGYPAFACKSRSHFKYSRKGPGQTLSGISILGKHPPVTSCFNVEHAGVQRNGPDHHSTSITQAELGMHRKEVKRMSLSKKVGRTVRYAIKKERRAVRLIGILVTVGVIDPHDCRHQGRDSDGRRLRQSPGGRARVSLPKCAIS